MEYIVRQTYEAADALLASPRFEHSPSPKLSQKQDETLIAENNVHLAHDMLHRCVSPNTLGPPLV